MSNFLLSLVFLLLPLGLSAQLIEGDDCSNPIDLSSISSPYIGSTINAADDYSENDLSGSDLMFYYDLEPGTSICVEGTDSNFSLVLAMYVGGDCPGGTMIDYGHYSNNRMCYTNNAGSTERVWIIVDSYGGPGGEFQLNWRLDEHPAPLFDISDIEEGDDFAILRWGSLPGVDGWQVRYANDDAKAPQWKVLKTTTNEVMLTEVERGTYYMVMVRALYNDGIAGTWTEKVNFEIPGIDSEEVSIPLSINNIDYYSIYTSTSYLRIMGGYYAIEAEGSKNSLVTPKFSDDLEGLWLRWNAIWK